MNRLDIARMVEVVGQPSRDGRDGREPGPLELQRRLAEMQEQVRAGAFEAGHELVFTDRTFRLVADVGWRRVDNHDPTVTHQLTKQERRVLGLEDRR